MKARSSKVPALASVESTWPKVRRVWSRHLEREQTEATRTTYLLAVDRFARWLSTHRGDRSAPAELAGVTSEDVLAWRDYLRRRYSLSTVNLYLSAVRSFYAWAISRGVDMPNPAGGVRGRGRKAAAYKRDAFSDGEVVSILGTCDRSTDEGARDEAIFCLMAYCALRTIEVQRAECGDLETRSDRLILWVWGKGRAEADEFVVLPAPAEDAIRHWMSVHPTRTGPLICSLARGRRGSRLSLRRLRAIVKRHIRLAGITSGRKSAHSFRHSAITNAIRHDATPLQAQQMARHGDVKTTLRYFHETDRLSNPAEDRIAYDQE